MINLSQSIGNFEERLKQANEAKNANAPVVVVLRGSHDHNGMFTSAPAQALLLQMSKTYRVIIKVIDDAKKFGLVMQDAYTLVNRKISILTIMTHGFSNQIQFGAGIPWYYFFSSARPFYQRKDILREDFTALEENAVIFLYSCSTGQGIAQDISNISGKTVYAPKGILYDTVTCLRNWPHPQFEMLSYNENNEQQMQVFNPYAVVPLVPSVDIFSEENKLSFSHMTDHLQEAAMTGDANAQWKFGMLHLLGLGHCKKSDESAVRWLTLAAEKGISQAQFELGLLYFLGRGGLDQSNEKAKMLIENSSKQGFSSALFQVGVFYLNGQCGFEASDSKAVEYFELAVKKGVTQALFNLAILYEEGRGVQRSLERAVRLYKIADGLGIEPAKGRLAALQE
jgi:TPR repeat protein